MPAPMQKYIRLLCEKIDGFSREFQRETMDLDIEIAMVDYNISHPSFTKKLQDLGKTIDQISFLRTELLLVKDRISRRTL